MVHLSGRWNSVIISPCFIFCYWQGNFTTYHETPQNDFAVYEQFLTNRKLLLIPTTTLRLGTTCLRLLVSYLAYEHSGNLGKESTMAACFVADSSKLFCETSKGEETEETLNEMNITFSHYSETLLFSSFYVFWRFQLSLSRLQCIVHVKLWSKLQMIGWFVQALIDGKS